jgi:hypothetical protein
MVTESPEYPTFACNGWSNQKALWISHSIRRCNTVKHQTLRGRETVLEALIINWKDMRMLGTRYRAIVAYLSQHRAA